MVSKSIWEKAQQTLCYVQKMAETNNHRIQTTCSLLHVHVTVVIHSTTHTTAIPQPSWNEPPYLALL